MGSDTFSYFQFGTFIQDFKSVCVCVQCEVLEVCAEIWGPVGPCQPLRGLRWELLLCCEQEWKQGWCGPELIQDFFHSGGHCGPVCACLDIL